MSMYTPHTRSTPSFHINTTQTLYGAMTTDLEQAPRHQVPGIAPLKWNNHECNQVST